MLNWSTKIFSRWHLIAKCIKFSLEVDTPIFLYTHRTLKFSQNLKFQV